MRDLLHIEDLNMLILEQIKIPQQTITLETDRYFDNRSLMMERKI
jgi:hypothetical protein